jgi:hypothetical protein
MPEIRYRFATPDDADVLAPMNQQLIRDEGHRSPLDLAQLTEQMAGWLRGNYQAVLFEDGSDTIGYALFHHEPEIQQGVHRTGLVYQGTYRLRPRGKTDVDFDGNVVRFSAGDGLMIPKGEKARHKAIVITKVVKLILVEDVE